MRERKRPRPRTPFTLPRGERTPLRAFVTASAGWAALLGALIAFRVTYVGYSEEATVLVALDIPAAPRRAQPPPGGAPREQPLPLLVPQPSATPAPAPDLRPFGEGPRAMTADDTLFGVPGGTGRRSLANLGPSFGDGSLWQRPELAEAGFPVENRPLNLDSVVRGRLLAMADSIERNPTVGGRPARLIFERNGRMYGMDERGNIHLGGITIPAALLALIPMPQGNIDQARANARLAAMRADIMRAAARAEAEDDFRRAVKAIRERNDRERRERRERERAQQGGERPIP